jgi:hypothetical protein
MCYPSFWFLRPLFGYKAHHPKCSAYPTVICHVSPLSPWKQVTTIQYRSPTSRWVKIFFWPNLRPTPNSLLPTFGFDDETLHFRTFIRFILIMPSHKKKKKKKRLWIETTMKMKTKVVALRRARGWFSYTALCPPRFSSPVSASVE